MSHPDRAVREFWIRHCRAARRIGARCVTNLWIPDDYKDVPADRLSPRRRLKDSLDEIFAEPVDERRNLDSLECKLFGIGSESYVVGSHEFYLAYALERDKALCLDTGHFHPTETVSGKLSALALFSPNCSSMSAGPCAGTRTTW